MSDRKLIVVGDREPYTGIGQQAGAHIRVSVCLDAAAPDADVQAAVDALAREAARVRDALDLEPAAMACDVVGAIARLSDERDKALAVVDALRTLGEQRERWFAENLQARIEHDPEAVRQALAFSWSKH